MVQTPLSVALSVLATMQVFALTLVIGVVAAILVSITDPSALKDLAAAYKSLSASCSEATMVRDLAARK